MSLPAGFYEALEYVLGPENVSADPAILYSYAGRSGLNGTSRRFAPLFETVVLPGSTQEVQAVVKLCNEHRVQYKASSTGWGFMSDPAGPGVIKIDLRRMNRILEINEESMYTVVQPYVIGAQLQAELMKRGLGCNLTGAGGNCSALPIAAHEGIGHHGQSMSYGDRNQLSLEWVAPDGNVVWIGSVGSTGEWFSGDGPGPSLRGVVRGNITPLGGMGVYTAAAMKVYDWPGPAQMPVTGASPSYHLEEMPQNFMIRYLSFSSREARFQALRKIGESEIAAQIMGFTPQMVAANVATSNEEDVLNCRQAEAEAKGPGFQIIIIGSSPRDFAYKARTLAAIVEETGAQSMPMLEDEAVGGGQLWRCLRITGSIRETLRATGSFGGVVGGTDQVELIARYVAETAEAKSDLIARNEVLDDGSEPFITSLEHGHFGHAELLVRYVPGPTSDAGMGRLMENAIGIGVERRLGVPHFVTGDGLHRLYGPAASGYDDWLRALKGVFDPNAVSEASCHITA